MANVGDHHRRTLRVAAALMLLGIALACETPAPAAAGAQGADASGADAASKDANGRLLPPADVDAAVGPADTTIAATDFADWESTVLADSAAAQEVMSLQEAGDTGGAVDVGAGPADAAAEPTPIADAGLNAPVDVADVTADGAGELAAAGEGVVDAPVATAEDATSTGDASAQDAAGADATLPADASPGAALPQLPPPPQTIPVDPTTLPVAAFVDDTAAYGINPTATHQACVAVADFDSNGREDFVVVETKGWSSTLHAVLLGGAGPKHVKTATGGSGGQANFGCTAVDMNGDDKPDLLTGGFSGTALYLGDGAGGFKDHSDDWLPYLLDFEAFSIVPADLDGDGDLDLFVGAGFAPPSCDALACNYTASDLLCTVNPPIPNIDKLQDRVLIQGPTLPMVDETKQWQPPPGGTQTVAMAADVDADGKMDVLVADDFGSSRILHNTGIAFQSFDTNVGLAPYAGAMGWTIGDFNSDGLPDLVIAESGPTPVYLNSPQWKGTAPFAFVDQGGEFGTWAPNWTASSWSPIVDDFDHNGYDDLWVANGVHVTKDMAANPKTLCAVSKVSDFSTMFVDLPSVDVLFLGQPGGGSKAHQIVAGKHAHIIIVEQRPIDLDDDGDLDLVQTRPGSAMMMSQVRILRNDAAKKGASFQVVLKGKGMNRDALGSTVTATVAGQKRTRWLNGSGAFGGTRSRIAHFGLGNALVADNVTVTWPDGSKTVLGQAQAGQTLKATWK